MSRLARLKIDDVPSFNGHMTAEELGHLEQEAGMTQVGFLVIPDRLSSHGKGN